MTGIVVRCPNCGTTQSAIGECEACHEATTRWFCPNHQPGLWLDAPLCPTCGARPGVPGARSHSTPAPTRPRTAPPPRPTPPRPATAPDAWRIDPSVGLPMRAVTFGCLRRLVILAFVLFVLAAIAFYMLFGVGGVFNVSARSAGAPRYAEVSGSTVAPNRAPSALR